MLRTATPATQYPADSVQYAQSNRQRRTHTLQEDLDICGDKCSAELLQFCEGRSRTLFGNAEPDWWFHAISGKTRSQFRDNAAPNFFTDLMGQYSVRKIGKALQNLVALGFLSRESRRTESFKSIYHYRVNLEVIHDSLQEWGRINGCKVRTFGFLKSNLLSNPEGGQLTSDDIVRGPVLTQKLLGRDDIVRGPQSIELWDPLFIPELDGVYDLFRRGDFVFPVEPAPLPKVLPVQEKPMLLTSEIVIPPPEKTFEILTGEAEPTLNELFERYPDFARWARTPSNSVIFNRLRHKFALWLFQGRTVKDLDCALRQSKAETTTRFGKNDTILFGKLLDEDWRRVGWDWEANELELAASKPAALDPAEVALKALRGITSPEYVRECVVEHLEAGVSLGNPDDEEAAGVVLRRFAAGFEGACRASKLTAVQLFALLVGPELLAEVRRHYLN